MWWDVSGQGARAHVDGTETRSVEEQILTETNDCTQNDLHYSRCRVSCRRTAGVTQLECRVNEDTKKTGLKEDRNGRGL